MTEFSYTTSVRPGELAPITTISMIFSDNDRRITVEGRSPDQVDAVFNWLATRNRELIAPVLIACLVIVLMVTLPFAEILAGFSVSAFDPVFANRYASEISAVSLFLAVVAIPLSFLLPKWFAQPSQTHQVPASATPTPSPKRTRRKRGAP